MRIIMRTRSVWSLLMSKAYKLPEVKPSLIKEPRASYSVGKQRLNITVRGDLIERARIAGLNISSVVEESLEERLRKSESERWLAENAEAIAYHNARIERDGPLCADLVSL